MAKRIILNTMDKTTPTESSIPTIPITSIIITYAKPITTAKAAPDSWIPINPAAVATARPLFFVLPSSGFTMLFSSSSSRNSISSGIMQSPYKNHGNYSGSRQTLGFSSVRMSFFIRIAEAKGLGLREKTRVSLTQAE